MFRGKISLKLVLLLLLVVVVKFVSEVKWELMYISMMVNIRPNLIHLYGFQLLVLLP